MRYTFTWSTNTINLLHFIDMAMQYTQQQLQEMGYANTNISGRFYLGLRNQKLLDSKWFQSKQWLTTQQAQKEWITVRTGEKATRIIYKNICEIEDVTDSGEMTMKEWVRLVYHDVFNVEQTDSTAKQESTWHTEIDVHGMNLTEKQFDLLRRLIYRKYTTPEKRKNMLATAKTLSKKEASKAIAHMIEY